MTCPGVGPCGSWDLDLSCCIPSGTFPDPCLTNGTPVSQDIVDQMVLAASQFMWRATGMQFGQCTVTLNLCKTDNCGCEGEGGRSDFNHDYGFGFPWYPAHLADGSWTNVSCNECSNCLCEKCRIKIPYPACSVDELVIDGEIVPPENYYVLDFKELAFSPAASGTCAISCGDTVTVTYGRPVPELVRLAAQEFACQLIKKCVGQPCDLPQRMTSITRQGVSVSFLDSMDFLKDGMTGIFTVDLAIRTYNPHGLYKKPSVSSPDSLGKWKVKSWQTGDS